MVRCQFPASRARIFSGPATTSSPSDPPPWPRLETATGGALYLQLSADERWRVHGARWDGATRRHVRVAPATRCTRVVFVAADRRTRRVGVLASPIEIGQLTAITLAAMLRTAEYLPSDAAFRSDTRGPR